MLFSKGSSSSPFTGARPIESNLAIAARSPDAAETFAALRHSLLLCRSAVVAYWGFEPRYCGDVDSWSADEAFNTKFKLAVNFGEHCDIVHWSHFHSLGRFAYG